MNVITFKQNFYLEVQGNQISNTEFIYQLYVKRRVDNLEITHVETIVNTFTINQDIVESRLSMNPIEWSDFLNHIIKSLFHMQMIKLNIEGADIINSSEEIADFFIENPFHQ